MLFQKIQRIQSLALSLKALLFLASFSLFSTANAEKVIDLRGRAIETVNLEKLRELSEGAIEKKASEGTGFPVYVLQESLSINCDTEIRFEDADLYIQSFDFVVNGKKIHFQNFSVNSFFGTADQNKSAGSLRFRPLEEPSTLEEAAMNISGKLSVNLVGSKNADGGSLEFPAHASFSLSLQYDLRSGGRGGENGELSYVRQGSRFVYEPEGILSKDLSLVRFPAS